MKSYIRIALLYISICLPAIVAGQELKKTFPRIGAYEIAGTGRITDPDYRDALSKHDIVILGMWRNWGGVDSATNERLGIRDVVVDIKRRTAANGGNILIGKYTVYNESFSSRSNSATRDRWDKLSGEIGPGYPVNNDWWARSKNGENTSSFSGTWNTNVTEFVTRDSNGDTWPEWAAKRDYEEFIKDIPEIDILFVDNWFYQPRVTADWDGDGKDDSKGEGWVRQAFRKGLMNAARRARQLSPGLIIMGNVDGNPGRNLGMLTEPEYKGQVAALYEGAMGRSFSQESRTSWDAMMHQYQTTIANSRDRLLIMTVVGDATDYKQMRYGLASCLMDDGYFYYTPGDMHYRSALWFDEFDVDLGQAIDPPQFSPWKDGVYRRRFEKGMAIVNPRNNGQRTVEIEPGYKRIAGQQDRSTNNGQPVSTVTLAERDGLILISDGTTSSNKVPMPPVLGP